MTYGVVSDIHAYAWSTFSPPTAGGINHRLMLILHELERAGDAVLDAGGHHLVIAGDIFHVRGSIDPEVLNPLQATIRRMLDKDLVIDAIPGNHDLKTKETTELGSAIQTLAETFSAEGMIRVHNKPTIISEGGNVWGFVPWRSSVAQLLEDLEGLAADDRREFMDVFIHAGIDGVLSGMPDHGLTAAMLAKFGFRRAFAGHYHNHKDLGDGVYSIGALTHQTWSDIGTKAGFLLVDGDGKVAHHASRAPYFVDGSDWSSQDDFVHGADGNYVRMRGEGLTNDEVKNMREALLDCGALGVSIQVAKAAVTARPGASTAKSLTLDQSVTGFIDDAKDIPAHIDRNEVKKRAVDVLNKSRLVAEET